MEGILSMMLTHSGSPQVFTGNNTTIGEIIIQIARVIIQKRAPL